MSIAINNMNGAGAAAAVSSSATNSKNKLNTGNTADKNIAQRYQTAHDNSTLTGNMFKDAAGSTASAINEATDGDGAEAIAIAAAGRRATGSGRSNEDANTPSSSERIKSQSTSTRPKNPFARIFKDRHEKTHNKAADTTATSTRSERLAPKTSPEGTGHIRKSSSDSKPTGQAPQSSGGFNQAEAAAKYEARMNDLNGRSMQRGRLPVREIGAKLYQLPRPIAA